jgi:hypothetical protein
MEDFWFRQVHDDLMDEEMTTQHVLAKWHAASLVHVAQLAKYGAPEAIGWKLESNDNPPSGISEWVQGPISKGKTSPAIQPQPQIPYDDIWDLYAMFRVSDLLLLPFQQGEYDGSSWSPEISLVQRTEYWLSLGMQAFSQPAFHPFYHEIVEVVQSEDPSEPITLVEEIWPGFMCGHMMFCRAGVKVRGGTNYIVKDIAEHSTIYFTYRRKNRPYDDLSIGWGSNSQWRTKFRRDYVADEVYYFNVDGSLDVHKHDPDVPWRNAMRDKLSIDERIELLTHRCFIRTNKPQNNLWPYDDFHKVRVRSSESE